MNGFGFGLEAGGERLLTVIFCFHKYHILSEFG